MRAFAYSANQSRVVLGSAEALCAPQANPITDGMALDAITRIGRVLRRIATDPSALSDVDIRAATVEVWFTFRLAKAS